MESKTIKVSQDNYLWLLNLSSDLQKKYGNPVTFDIAINYLRKKPKMKKNIFKTAGKWKMSNKEADNLKKEIKKGWSEWNIKSF